MPESHPTLDIPYGAPTIGDLIEKTHANLHVTPNDDPKLAYRLGVPAKWAYSKEFGPVVDQLMIPRGLGFFAGSIEVGSPVIAVTLTRVPFEIPLHAWVRLTLGQQGYKVVAARYFPGPHSVFFDATAVGVREGREEVVRTTARVDGSNIFSVNTVCDRGHWDAAKEIFWIAHVSFKLLSPTGIVRMEPIKKVHGENPDFQTAHPFSWFGEKVESGWPDISAVNIRLLNAKQSVLLGYVQVRAHRLKAGAPVPSLPFLRDESLASLKRSMSFVPAGAFVPLTEDDDPWGPAAEGWLGGFFGEGKIANDDVAVRLGYLARAGITFGLIAFSAPARDDVLAALRTQRAFEVARESLRLPDAPRAPVTPKKPKRGHQP